MGQARTVLKAHQSLHPNKRNQVPFLSSPVRSMQQPLLPSPTVTFRLPYRSSRRSERGRSQPPAPPPHGHQRPAPPSRGHRRHHRSPSSLRSGSCRTTTVAPLFSSQDFAHAGVSPGDDGRESRTGLELAHGCLIDARPQLCGRLARWRQPGQGSSSTMAARTSARPQ